MQSADSYAKRPVNPGFFEPLSYLFMVYLQLTIPYNDTIFNRKIDLE